MKCTCETRKLTRIERSWWMRFIPWTGRYYCSWHDKKVLRFR